MTDSQTVVSGEYVQLGGETYYKIENSHEMPDFFMSLVGAGDHWMFVSSQGALTAGRRNPDSALFPYAADDQISAARGHTGSMTIIRTGGELWEPFTRRVTDDIRRNLYKTPLGNKLVFEEVNDNLQLTFRCRWAFSQRFGIVRSCTLVNNGPRSQTLVLVDGIRNVLPYGVGSEFIMRFSNLANAYKKSELVATSSVGLFYLSSIPTDRAEPSEGLKATVVWQTGLSPSATLLSEEQLSAFYDGSVLQTEAEVRGKPGAYLLSQTLPLAAQESISWQIVAEVEQDYADVVRLDAWLQETSDANAEVEQDIQASQQKLLRIVSSSDGLQCGANKRRANRHLSNTVFNVMRGGVPLENYCVDRRDFLRHVSNFNRLALARHKSAIEDLPSKLTLSELHDQIAALGDADLNRLAMEYLPLTFSRRHGDPTRPWNRFSIDLTSPDGSTNLNYQGNWRDIFQNWEALALSFPGLTTSMICRFVNATTADGYNPYRLTKNGFEWEEPTPEDPWANIGYWGDHQIIYLLKLLEASRRLSPDDLDSRLDTPAFTHANIPYRIKDFEAMKENPRDTIQFDRQLSDRIRERVSEIGADGKLLQNQQGQIHYVTLMEKLLTLSLAKLANFIPDGGIWLNTQRPEWNDANNALVGNGLSVVTACYLHRWFAFLEEWVSESSADQFRVSSEVVQFFDQIATVLRDHEAAFDSTMNASKRRQVVTSLSQAGSDYRKSLYSDGLAGTTKQISREDCLAFLRRARHALQATIRHNRRSDGLYHSYNLLDWRDDGAHVESLYEMLEGQVAVLSARLLPASEVVELLDALRNSALYRANQDSYLLYPDRQLPRFLEKNIIPEALVAENSLVNRLVGERDTRIVTRDQRGGLHFNGSFRNSADLRAALDGLGSCVEENHLENRAQLVSVFEQIFSHRQFTGRSGTFFAYEGLGSIYWHMVSKLGLAVAENFFWALDHKEPDGVVQSLNDHLQAIRRGIGAEKTPLEYGAFPSDPYSHTPENAGVKQPGMTGQVKEDILARFAELGVHIEDGGIRFRWDLFDRNELLEEPSEFEYADVTGQFRKIAVPARGFAFTFCQVPVVYQLGQQDSICVHFKNGQQTRILGGTLDQTLSRSLFLRTGDIERIECSLSANG